MRQYQCFELRFQGPELAENWAQVDLTAEFTVNGQTKTVKGFYAGNGSYAVRYLPEQAGLVRWKLSGVVNAEGSEECEGAAAGQHGLVKAVETHFAFEDGAPFYPFGTTVYALAHQEDALVEQTLQSLKTAPFNKVRMCVFPKSYDFNHNEPPLYAFEKKEDGSWDVKRPCIAFWDRFENILDRINDMGIQVDLILFHSYDRWGFSKLSQQDNLIYLDYLLRRLAAKPGIWWSLANEYDLCAKKSLADWEEIECYIAENDPYAHLLSNHNCFCFWDATRPNTTHASIQTKALTEIPRWMERYQKPVIIDECCYEGNLPHFWGSISAREMVNRFWRCIASGSYCTHGETFLDENDVLWWAKGGVLKGQSPERIAFLREIVEALPGPLTPMATGVLQLANMSEEQLAEGIKRAPEGLREMVIPIVNSIRRMDPVDRTVHLSSEHEWAACCGEESYLWFNDRQCSARQTIALPEDKHYRVELIDVWEMSRTILEERASGSTTLTLPGREGLAVLAVRVD